MKIIFFGTAHVALPVLEELNRKHQVLAVVTTPDVKVGRKQELTESPVSSLARRLKLKVFKPEHPKNDPEFLSELKKLNADIFVVVAYGKILPAEIINLPKFKTVNVHFSLLPKYRGASPIQTALLNGEWETGTSIFILNEKVDAGAILRQERIDVEPNDNYETLSDRLARLSAEVIDQTLGDYASGKLTPLPQDESRVSHTKIIKKEDGRVDWNKSAEQIYNQFRAFYVWPGIWTAWKGQNLKIAECEATELENKSATENYRIGIVLDRGIVVCGKNSALKITRLQLAGKNETTIQEFLNGHRDFIGSRLG